MKSIKVKQVLVWSSWSRIGHWCIAISTILLISTGLLITYSPVLTRQAADIHYLSASILVFGITIRILLMFIDNSQLSFKALFPSLHELSVIKQMFLFYLSFGKQPLPNWYAQNPLWKPIYLFIYLSLILLIISGYFINKSDLVINYYPPSVHRFWSDLIIWSSGLHILAVSLHDSKGRSDISSMFHGYRYFKIENQDKPANFNKTLDLKK